MTTQHGSTSAGDDDAAGAGSSQTSEAEVTKLLADLKASQDLVATRDTSLEAATKALGELQEANKQFADDAAGLAGQAEQITTLTSALEESRKSTAEMTVKLEEAATVHSTLQDTVTSRRRKDLVSQYGLPEERVASLDDTALKVLEDTLPHTKSGQANGTNNGGTNNGGTGYGMGGGSSTVDISQMSDIQKAARTIEDLKSKSK